MTFRYIKQNSFNVSDFFARQNFFKNICRVKINKNQNRIIEQNCMRTVDRELQAGKISTLVKKLGSAIRMFF